MTGAITGGDEEGFLLKTWDNTLNGKRYVRGFGRFDASPAMQAFQFEEGGIKNGSQCSVTIDGISLTVAYVDSRCFKVSLIPHTAANTTLLMKKAGDTVNLENDIVGKYIDKLMHFDNGDEDSKDESSQGISMEFLSQNGFM